MPVDVSEDYIRIRVEDPGKFEEDTFRIIWISKADKIKAVAGRLKGETSLTTQSFLFDKSAWTVDKAKQWVKDHGYTIRASHAGVRAMPDDLHGLSFTTKISRQIQPSPNVPDDLEWEMIIEAWASTPDIDRYETIIPPTAFARTMPTFMATQPVMMFNHRSEWTIGRVLDYKISEKGLWIQGGIAPTDKGKELATLIRYGVVSAMSFQFDVIESEHDAETDKLKLIDVNIYEIGPVSIPGNPQAIIEQARDLGIELKSLTIPSGVKGNTFQKGEPTMPDILTEEKVRTLVDSSVKTASEGIKQDTDIRIHEVAKQVDNLVKVQKDIQDAMTGSTKTNAEMRQFVERVETDFKKAVDGLNAEITEVRKRREPPIITEQFCSYKLKDLIEMEPAKIRSLFPDKAGLILELHKLNDACVLKDAYLATNSEREGGEYHRQPKEKRIRSLPEFAEMLRFQRALDSSTSTEGAELIPTDFAGTIHELIRAELKVAPLFENFPMPTNPFKFPVESADVIAKVIAQTTTYITGWDAYDETPTTSNVTLTAEKLRARIQASSELIEDSAIPITPWVQTHASRAIARAIDRAIVEGQETASIDTGATIQSYDARKIWDGLRYYATQSVTSAKGIDCGTFSEDNLRKIRQNMGTYGLYFSDLAWIASIITYLGRFMKDLDQILTMDKYGPNAVVLSGEVMKFDNIPVIVSEFARDDLNATGIYDGETVDKSLVLLVNRRGFILGNRKETTVSIVPDKINDVSTIVAFWRGDFQPWWTPSTTVVPVNYGYNIATS